MKFDPTFNYSVLDMKTEENLICWKFGELVKILVTMTKNADRQIEIMGACIVTDEMAEDFNTFYTLSYKRYLDYGLLSDNIIEKLNQLEKFLDKRSGDKNPDFWNDLKLSTNKDWETVRTKTKEILTMLNMDKLELDFDRAEKHETTSEGQKLYMQTTKTRLINKNAC